MEIIVIASKLVKPSNPTPSTLRNYHLSSFDQIQFNMNIPLILYYFTSHKEESGIQTKIFNPLEISLSKTLTEFYPLAGRYVRDASFIHCSDQGALYIQAKAKFQLSYFLGLKTEMKQDMLQDFLPCKISKAGEINDPILSVKVTTFECGGVAIGMCMSHKFADMNTFNLFINHWATRMREIGNECSLEQKLEKYSPVFNLAHLFPKADKYNNNFSHKDATYIWGTNAVERVFSFKGSTIKKLREKIMSDQNNIIRHRPSKVQLLVALFWKALVDIDKADGQAKVSFVSQPVNLRNELPENSCGNFIALANARVKLNEEDNIDLQVLLNLLHDSIDKVKNNNSLNFEVLVKPGQEYMENSSRNDVKAYIFSSWCNFSFHTADFGWDKPVWKSVTADIKYLNSVFMMDDEEGDGVEVWVTLDKKQLCELEQDPNIQAYMDVRF